MKRILLAEDDNDMRQFLTRALKNAGYEVVSFDNGLSAYERLREEPFSLLLSDIVMPEMDGIELARRATELDPNLAAAYLTWGKLYVRANRYSEAAPLLERAVSIQPELLEAHYQLSRVLVKLKRTDEANRELEIFKQLTAKQKARNEGREIVRRLANVRF